MAVLTGSAAGQIPTFLWASFGLRAGGWAPLLYTAVLTPLFTLDSLLDRRTSSEQDLGFCVGLSLGANKVLAPSPI